MSTSSSEVRQRSIKKTSKGQNKNTAGPSNSTLQQQLSAK